MVLPQSVAGLFPKYVALAGQIGELLVVAAVVYVLGRFVLEPAVAWLFARRDLDPTLARALQKVLHVGVIVATLAVGAAAAGFGGLLGGSALIVAALTLAVGFAAQDVISNFVAGVFIVQDRNFTIDDWIEWDDKAGYIDDIGFRVTRIRTFDNETITVPNTVLATTPVTNRMSNETLRISYAVGVGYTDDIDAAMRILLDAAADHDDILADPEPSVRVADLGDSAVVLQARFWIADPDREEFSATRSAYIRTVNDRCAAAGIDLSTTTQHDLSGALTIEESPAA
jgi:small-conductance mechanosensitive channel